MAGEPAQALKYTVWPLACDSMVRQAALSTAKAGPVALAPIGSDSAAAASAGRVMRASAWRRVMDWRHKVNGIGESISTCLSQIGPKLLYQLSPYGLIGAALGRIRVR